MTRFDHSRKNSLFFALALGLLVLLSITNINAQILTPGNYPNDACGNTSRFFVSGSQPARSTHTNFIRVASFNVNTSGVGGRNLNSFSIELIGDFDAGDLENGTGGALFYTRNFSANAATNIRSFVEEAQTITGPGTYTFTPSTNDGQYWVFLELSPNAEKNHFWLRQTMNSSNFSFSPSTTLSGEVSFRTGTTEPLPSLPENFEFIGQPGAILINWDPNGNERHIFKLFNNSGGLQGTYISEGVNATSHLISSLPVGRYDISVSAENDIGGGCTIQKSFSNQAADVPSCFSKPAKPNVSSANPTPIGGVSIQTSGIPLDPSNPDLYERNPSTNEGYRRVSIARELGSPRVFPVDGSMPETFADDQNRVSSSSTVNGVIGIGTAANPAQPNTTYEIDIYTLHLGPTLPGTSQRCILYSSQFSRTLITTCADGPTEIATNLSVSNVLENSAQLNWDNGDGAQRLVVVKPGLGQQFESINLSPMAGMDFNANFNFPDAPLIPQVPTIHNSFQILNNTDGRVVYKGSGSSVTVTGLSTGTGYTWHVLELNDTGECALYNTTRVMGSEGTFTTNSNLLDVSTQSATNITSSSAIIGGNVELLNNVNVTERGVVWSTASNPDLTDNRVIAGAGSGAFTTNIQGLNPERRHFVKAYAIALGQTFFGNERQFFTVSNAPSGDPANFELINLQSLSDTELSATFDWDGATGASGYLLLYRRDGNLPTATGIEDGVNPEDLDLTVGTFLASDQLIQGTGFTQNNGIFPNLEYNYLLIPVAADQDNNPQTYNYKTTGAIPTLSFTTDLEPPSIISFQPQNGEQDVPLGSVLSIQMNEVVTKGSGDIAIVDAASQNTIRTISIASADVSINGQIVTIDPSGLPVSTEMYPTIPEGAFTDAHGNELAAFTGKGNSWQFTTADQGDGTSPVLTRLTPENGSPNVNTEGTIRLDFNEPIIAKTGNLTIKRVSNNSDVQVIPIDGPAVEAFQSYVTISPDILPGETDIYVLLDNGAITDASGNDYGGITNSSTWTFTTGVSPDVTPPTLSTLVPADDATNVALNAPLVIRFDEPVAKGSGFISIKFTSDGTTRETVNVNGTAVTISGNQATVIPSNALPDNTQLFVEISDGAFRDTSGNNFVGISDPTVWSFTTTSLPDGNQPQLLANSINPATGAFDIAFDTNLQFSFNENVLKGTGDILIRNQFTDEIAATINVTSAHVNISNNEVTINPLADLPEGSFSVEIPGTAFKDGSDNFFPGLLDESWTFTTVSAPPSLLWFAPSDGAGDVALDATLTLNFDEEVEPGTSGSLQIRNRSTNGLIVSVQPEAGIVNYSGQQVTVSLNLGVAFFGTEVFVSISDGFVQDLNGNPFSDGFNDLDTWNFTFEDQSDVTAPSLVTNSFSPADNAIAVATDTDLVFSFNEPVTLSGGRINIKNSSTDAVVETVFLTTNVSISGNQVTVERTGDLGEGQFYIEIDEETFTDASGNEFAGLFNKNTWNFTTVGTPPSVDELIPVIGATNVPVIGTAIATFDEPITLGSSGSIFLRRMDNNATLQTIPRTDPAVSINGSTLSIEYDITGFESTDVFIQVQTGSIEDLNGNVLIALNGNTWNFTTAAAPDVLPPLVIGGSGFSPSDNATLVAPDTDLQITFNEEVQAGSGLIFLHRASDDVVLQTITSDDEAVTINGAVVTIDPPQDLEDVAMYVNITSDAFQDNSGNFYSGIDNSTTWNFVPQIVRPTFVTMEPENGSIDIPVGEAVTFDLFFSENIQLGNSGQIRILLSGNNAALLTIPYDDAGIEITGNRLSFEATIPLTEAYSETSFYVHVLASMIQDLNGNATTGNIGTSTLTQFTTEKVDQTSPFIVQGSYFPADDANNVPYNTDLSFEFSEEVVKGTGNIVIHDASDGSVIRNIDVSSSEVSINGTTVTINPVEDLPEEIIYVEVEHGAFEDPFGNAFSQNIAWSTVWRFFMFEEPLEIINFSPAHGSTNIQINESIPFEITFSHDIAINPQNPGDILIRFNQGNGIRYTLSAGDPGMTIDGNKLRWEQVFDPGLHDFEFFVQVQSGALIDLDGRSFSRQLIKGQWHFIMEPETKPEVISLSPMDDATNQAVDVNLVATFNEDVTINTSFHALIRELSNGNIVEVFDDEHAGVTVSGNQLTIDPTNDLEEGKAYYVTLSGNSVLDDEEAGNLGINGNSTWNFSVGDTENPVLSTLTPADNATEVALDTDFSIQFNEPVQIASSGNIVLRRSSGQNVEIVPITDPRVTGFGTNTLTVDFNAILATGVSYYITLPANGVEDLIGNPFPGWNDTETWTFTASTVDIINPLLVSLSPENGESQAGTNVDLVIELNEALQWGSGNILLKEFISENLVETFNSGSGNNSVNGSTLALNLSGELSATTQYYVEVEATALEDISGNAYSGFTGKTTWNFTTLNTDNVAPSIVSLSPTDDDTTVPEDIDELVITYDEPVVGLSGAYNLRIVGNSGIFRSWTIGTEDVEISGNTVILKNVGGLTPHINYYIRNVAIVHDLAGNSAETWNTSETRWNFSTFSDITAPTIVSRFPADDAMNVNAGTNISVEFSENISPSGFIVAIREYEGDDLVKSLFNGASELILDGNIISIDLDDDLERFTQYYVTITGVKDLATNPFPDITDKDDWNFIVDVIDNDPPTITSLTPPNGSTDIPLEVGTLSMTFSEPVFPVAGQFIRLRNVAGNGEKQAFQVDTEDVTIDGNTVILNNVEKLAAERAYWLQGLSVLTDEAGNPVSGWANDASTWSFTTEAIPDDIMLSPADNDLDIDPFTDLQMTFNKPINKGTGFVKIFNRDDDTELISLNVQSSDIVVNNTLVTITPPGGLPDFNIPVYVLIDAGAFVDDNNNEYPGVTFDSQWNFTLLSTDQSAPTIVSTSPADGAVDIDTRSNLIVEFDEDIVILDNSRFRIRGYDSPFGVFQDIYFPSEHMELDGNVLTINPPNNMPLGNHLWIEIPQNRVRDEVGNLYFGINTTNREEWDFNTLEVLFAETLNPSSGSSDISLLSELSLEYNRPMLKGSGFIRIINNANSQELLSIDVNSDQVEVVDGIATIRPTNGLPGPDLSLSIVLEAGVFVDEFDNPSLPINNFSWLINTELEPEIDVFSPADGAGNVSPSTNPVITFSKPMQKGTGNITIKKVVGGDILDVIDVNSNEVSIDGVDVTISPTFGLPDNNVSIFIDIEDGAFADLSGISFPGIQDVWNFTLQSNDQTAPTVTSVVPANGATDVPINVGTLSMTLSEPVFKVGGTLRLFRLGSGAIKEFQVNSDDLTVTDNVVTFNDVPTLDFETTYWVQNFNHPSFEDAVGNDLAPWNTNTFWSFTTELEPDRTMISPAHSSDDISPFTDLEITFNKPIAKGSGSVRVFDFSNDSEIATIDVNSVNVSITDDVATISIPGGLPDFNINVYVLVDDGVFEDTNGNPWSGISNKFLWRFDLLSTDQTGPTIVNLTPMNDATDVDTKSNLVIEFSEDVFFPNNFTIRVRRYSNNSVAQNISAVSTNVEINGNQVTIAPINDLEFDERLWIEIPAFSITDEVGNFFSGIVTANRDDWDFITVPELIHDSFTPTDGAIDVSPSADLTLEFPRDVFKGTGNIRVLNYDDNVELLNINVSSPEVSISAGTVTITPSGGLPDNNIHVRVIIDEGAFVDDFGNTSAEIFTGQWNFTILSNDVTAPALLSLDPGDGASNISTTNWSFNIEFDEPVKKGSGIARIRVYDTDGLTANANLNDHITVMGNTATIDFNALGNLDNSHLNFNTRFYIEIGDGLFEDLVGNAFTGHTKDDWDFTTEAATPPLVVNRTPEDDALDIEPDQDITIEFNEDIMLGNNGATKWMIIKNFPNSNFEIVDLTGPKANISGNTLTVSHDDFVPGNSYYILLADGVIADLSNSWFPGYTNSNEWNFTVEKYNQTITFEELSVKTFGDTDFELTGEASSALEIEYESSDESVATVSGSTVTIIGAGTASITASQSGDDSYNAAVDVVRTLTVIKADQTIIIDPIPDKLTTDASFMASASVGSGLPLTYEVSGPATISDKEISLTGESGTITLTVNQAGNENYNAASAQISFEVGAPVTPNNVPSDINLTNSTIEENLEAGTLVGELSSPDLDPDDQHVYSLVPGEGDDDNNSFNLSGNQLLSGEVFDFETRSSYTIRVKSDDQNGGAFEKSFTIIIEDIEENVVTAIDNDFNYSISVYPNPATEVVNISNLGFVDSPSSIELLGLDGAILKRVEVHSNVYSFDLTNIKSGLYLIRVVQDIKSTTTRLLVR